MLRARSLFASDPLHQNPSRRQKRNSWQAQAKLRAAIEPLEQRRLLAAITVNTTDDDLIPNDGNVSLREAITAINVGNNLGDPDITAQNPGVFHVAGVNDIIHFNIPGAGQHTIAPTGALPLLAFTTID